MISRILIALFVVICVYFFPSNAEYTDLAKLRENSYMSALIISVMILFVGRWLAYAICAIEIALIGSNLYLAYNWSLRDIIFIGNNYPALQEAAFFIEVAIICVYIVTGLREIGSDCHRINNKFSAVGRGTRNGERH